MVTGWGPVLQWPPSLSEAPGIRVQAAPLLILTRMGINLYEDKWGKQIMTCKSGNTSWMSKSILTSMGLNQDEDIWVKSIMTGRWSHLSWNEHPLYSPAWAWTNMRTNESTRWWHANEVICVKMSTIYTHQHGLNQYESKRKWQANDEIGVEMSKSILSSIGLNHPREGTNVIWIELVRC